MVKMIKKVVLCSLSVLGISFLIWIVFLLNPNLSYANQTQFDNVIIFHNQDLEEGTGLIIRNALSIIEKADIYDKSLKIQLCLNDNEVYPKLYPFAGATAYAFSNKTVIYASTPSFEKNYTEFSWKINNNELRRWNLTSLLAHEFMHNVQSHHNTWYYIKSTLGHINWKFEGHAEYIARQYQDDGRLIDKLNSYLIEENKEHIGIPVMLLDDGTILSLSYFKYALVIQYLMEEKELSFDEISNIEEPFGSLYAEMLEWSKR